MVNENYVLEFEETINSEPWNNGQVLVKWVNNGNEKHRYFHKYMFHNIVNKETIENFLREIHLLPSL